MTATSIRGARHPKTFSDLVFSRIRRETISRPALRAIEGKTWNHPAMSDGILLIRNIEEMAAFDLTEGMK